jgi:hypothetical protein
MTEVKEFQISSGSDHFTDVDLNGDHYPIVPSNSNNQKQQLKHSLSVSSPIYTNGKHITSENQKRWRELIREFDVQFKVNFVICLMLAVFGFCAFVVRLVAGIVQLSDDVSVTIGCISILCGWFTLISTFLGICGSVALIRHNLELFRFYTYGVVIAGIYMVCTSVILCIVSFYFKNYFNAALSIGGIVVYGLIFIIIFIISYKLVVRMDNEKTEELKSTYRGKIASSWASDNYLDTPPEKNRVELRITGM